MQPRMGIVVKTEKGIKMDFVYLSRQFRLVTSHLLHSLYRKTLKQRPPHFTYFHFLVHLVLRRNFYSNPFRTLSLPFHLGVEELETEKRKTWDSKRSRWPTPSLRWTVRFRSPYFSLICLMDYVSMLIICLHGSGLFLIILVYGFCVYVCV